MPTLIREIINKLIRKNKQVITLDELPSKGLFYPDDFEIVIHKPLLEDYNSFKKASDDSDNPLDIITTIKDIIKKRTSFPTGYTFEYIRAADILFIFFKLIKLHTGDEVIVCGNIFKPSNLKYFNYNKLMKYYNNHTKSFDIDGFSFKLPAIGIEISLNHFMYDITIEDRLDEFKKYSYNFIYFLGDRTKLNYKDFINLIDLFNNDLDDKERKNVQNITDMFKNSSHYYIINMSSGKLTKINIDDLRHIWEIRK